MHVIVTQFYISQLCCVVGSIGIMIDWFSIEGDRTIATLLHPFIVAARLPAIIPVFLVSVYKK